jgi:hypothetical protein
VAESIVAPAVCRLSFGKKQGRKRLALAALK